jgi:phenylacetate-CoA ligase
MKPWIYSLSDYYLIWRHQFRSREEIIAYQNQKLRRIISYAYKNVPYYRKLFDEAKILPRDIKTVADLQYIPLTSKKDIKSYPLKYLQAKGFSNKKLMSFKTTGTTGIPFETRISTRECFFLDLFMLRAMHYYGIQSTDKMLKITLLPRGKGVLPWRLLQGMGLFKQVKIPYSDSLDYITKSIREEGPDVLIGYPGVLSRIAQFINSQSKETIRPRFLVTHGELHTPLMRQQIKKAFRAPVYDMYQSVEIHLMAWECKQTENYHVCDDNLILEVLNNGNPVSSGEKGEVVATNLNYFSMPFIRCRMADIVTKGSETCQCGLPFSTIRTIQGRIADWFLLPGGRELWPVPMALIIQKHAPWILQSVFIQEREDRIVLKAVTDTNPSLQELEPLRKRIKKVLGTGVNFEIEFVPEIKPGPGGKFWHFRPLFRKNNKITN